MSKPATVSNHVIAERARQVAADAPRGSLTRLAGNCLSACLVTTSSVPAGRKALADIDRQDIRRRAAEVLAGLLGNDVPAQGGAAQEGTP